MSEKGAKNAMSNDPILTAREIATELRCSKAQVLRIINGAVKGVTPLASISLGRKKVIRRSTFEAWKRVNEATAVSDAKMCGESETKAGNALN
jgi:hypothetical protein